MPCTLILSIVNHLTFGEFSNVLILASETFLLLSNSASSVLQLPKGFSGNAFFVLNIFSFICDDYKKKKKSSYVLPLHHFIFSFVSCDIKLYLLV